MVLIPDFVMFYILQVLTDKNNELHEKYKDVDIIPKPDYWYVQTAVHPDQENGTEQVSP